MLAARQRDDDQFEFSITADGALTDVWLPRDQAIMRLAALGVDDAGHLIDGAEHYGAVHI